MSRRYQSPRGNPGVVRFLPLFFPGGEEDEGPMMAEAVRGRRIVYSEERGLSVSVLLPGFQSQRGPPGPVPLFVVVSVVEFCPPIHRLDLGRSPRFGSGFRLSGGGRGDAGEKTGDTTPSPPRICCSGFCFFPGLSRLRRSRLFFVAGRGPPPPGPLGPSCVRGPGRSLPRRARRLWAPSFALGRWGGRRRAGRRQRASPRVFPGGSRPCPRPPMFPATPRGRDSVSPPVPLDRTRASLFFPSVSGQEVLVSPRREGDVQGRRIPGGFKADDGGVRSTMKVRPPS
ncbi:hypothetical protein NDU88_001586 [Pleurodeles waltl]|uniref:Uncharacterized protein n=1 Tax=Pleurodeles waltl TaxID=8319 RepID=A0AAV7VC84_PLEWA|nr:hypothetical protein NDU88_001586 [Pleurodeles waltl]